MTFHEEIEALRAEVRDIRNDAVGPVERLAAENNHLRDLLKRTYRHFTAKHDKLEQRINRMVTNIDALSKAVTDTIAFLNSLAAAGAVPQAEVDTLATNLGAALTAAQAKVNPPAPTGAGAGATA